MFRGLHGQNVGHMFVRNGIAVGLELEVSFEIADPKRHFRAVVGMERQRSKRREFLFEKEFQRRSAGCLMHVDIALLAKPPSGAGAKIVEILELAAAQEIPLPILKRALDLPLRFGPAPPADNRAAAIMGDEGGKGRVDHRPARLPAQDDRLLAVVETLGRGARKMREGVLMAANQGEKIPPRGKVDVMPAGEPEDVGKTLYGGFAGFKELDGVRTPVHLSLKAGLRLEADDGRFFRAGPEMPKPILQDADAASIACVAKLFEEPLPRDPGIFF